MNFKEFIDEMKNNLTPHNPEWPSNKDYDIVKMGIHSNYGYMNGELIRNGIECFNKRSMEAFALGEKLNDLEALGAILLMESAYMMDKAKQG